jgi:hypothetical protein
MTLEHGQPLIIRQSGRDTHATFVRWKDPPRGRLAVVVVTSGPARGATVWVDWRSLRPDDAGVLEPAGSAL